MSQKITQLLLYTFSLVLIMTGAYLISKTHWYSKFKNTQTLGESKESFKTSRQPSSATKSDQKKDDEPSLWSRRSYEGESRRTEMQSDANTICRSRSAVKLAANTYDEYIWKCNNPPYGVRYTDCNQYSADSMATQVRQVANQRDLNELSFAKKWGVDPAVEVRCY